MTGDSTGRLCVTLCATEPGRRSFSVLLTRWRGEEAHRPSFFIRWWSSGHRTMRSISRWVQSARESRVELCSRGAGRARFRRITHKVERWSQLFGRSRSFEDGLRVVRRWVRRIEE